MKDIKMIVGLLFIYSCTPVITNTLPSPSLTPTKSPNITATPTSSVSPSISVSPITPISPNPSPSESLAPQKEVLRMQVVSEDDGFTVGSLSPESFNNTYAIYQNPYLPKYSYKALLGESKKFKAILFYKDGTQSNEGFTWTSSNQKLITTDNQGLVKTALAYPDIDTPSSSTITVKSKDVKYEISFTVIAVTSVTYKEDKIRYSDNCREQTPYTEILPIQRYQCLNCTISHQDITEQATFKGKVYDPNLVQVEGATVNARSVDTGFNWVGESQITVGGDYVFRNAPPRAKIAITVTKDGWTTRTRIETLKSSNFQGNPCANVFDFENNYAIQDEPEVTQIKINGRLVSGSSIGDSLILASNLPKNSKPTPENLDNSNQINNIGNIPVLTGVNSNTLDIEMTFSEPVRRDDVENYLRITSQSGIDNKSTSFTVDNNYSGVRFEWSADDKVVTFKTNKAVLSNRGGDEARYLLDFLQSFRDKTDRSSIDKRYFRFSPTQINDFVVFSVKNDEEAPKLLGITARDGGGSNDILELRYSESMELINQASYTSGLVDQLLPSDKTRQFYTREANNQAFDLAPFANNSSDNNATLLGFLDSANGNNFKASYMIGRILAKNVTSGNPKVDVLGTTVNTIPTKTKVISARITNNIVTLELDKDSFDRDDRVIVSAADRITGSYVDRNRAPSVNEDLFVSTNPLVEYSNIFDPSGRLIDSGNSSTSANIDVDNSQRVATAS